MLLLDYPKTTADFLKTFLLPVSLPSTLSLPVAAAYLLQRGKDVIFMEYFF